MTRIEIRPGEGGDDAVEFANQIGDAVTRFARKSGQALFEHNSRTVITIETDLDS